MYTAGGQVTLGSGTGGASIAGIFQIDAGTAALNGGIRTGNEGGSTIRVAGGTFTTTDVNIGRNSAGTVAFTSGLIVTGGTATVGTIALGTGNSNGAMSVEGGALTATGVVTIGNQATATRGGIFLSETFAVLQRHKKLKLSSNFSCPVPSITFP